MQTLRQRWMKMLLLFVFIMAAAVPIVAQEGDQNIPQAVQLALTNLNQRLREDVTLDDLDSYEWTAKEFSDTSLGCPQPDMMYAQVITPGYEVLFTYDGTTYDYRVAEEGETVTLCDTVSTDPTTTPVAGDRCPQYGFDLPIRGTKSTRSVAARRTAREYR